MMELNQNDLIKLKKYTDLINKHFGDNYDKYWTTFIVLWILENVENKDFNDIENIIIKTKNIVDELGSDKE